MPRRPPPPATAVALVLAFAGLVAVASRTTPVWAPLREGRADRLEILLNLVVWCGLGFALATAVTWALHRALLARRPSPPSFGTTLLRALPAISVLVAVSALLVIARSDLGRSPAPGEPGHVVEESGRPGEILNIVGWFGARVFAGDGERDEQLGPDQGPEEPNPWPLIVAGIVAALVAGGVVWRWRAGEPPASHPEVDEPDRPEEPDPDAVHGAVVGSIDAMLADPDPRTAIIGAYARLMEGLETRGAGRRDHEAPMEHLRRVLARVHVQPEPLRQLLALFQTARFSTHPLDAADRERALEALRTVAADLAPVAVPIGAGT